MAVSIAKLELGSAATLHDLERFLVRLRVCGSAPTSIERLLTPEHRFPNAANVLADARGETDRLTAVRQRLEATFAPGDAPDSQGVQDLKKRLRTTGGRWFSIFNRDYREARKTVLGFLRSRKLRVFPAILESLDQLEQWSKNTEDFTARPELRSVLGVGFAGVETDWPAVTAASSGRSA